jgi:hypothetical protein
MNILLIENAEDGWVIARKVEETFGESPKSEYWNNPSWVSKEDAHVFKEKKLLYEELRKFGQKTKAVGLPSE